MWDHCAQRKRKSSILLKYFLATDVANTQLEPDHYKTEKYPKRINLQYLVKDTGVHGYACKNIHQILWIGLKRFYYNNKNLSHNEILDAITIPSFFLHFLNDIVVYGEIFRPTCFQFFSTIYRDSLGSEMELWSGGVADQ